MCRFLFCQRCPSFSFLVKVSFPINRTAATIISELKDIFKIYNARGFKIVEVHADNEFNKIEKDILPVRLQTVGTDEHVPEIEELHVT